MHRVDGAGPGRPRRQRTDALRPHAAGRTDRLVRADPAGRGDPAAAFRAQAEDLLGAWRDHSGPVEDAGLDWQCAELAVHTWDLATAVHAPTSGLDPEVAERGLAFMSQGLTPDNRGGAFGAEVEVPADAPVYDRLAAFAGRDPADTP